MERVMLIGPARLWLRKDEGRKSFYFNSACSVYGLDPHRTFRSAKTARDYAVKMLKKFIQGVEKELSEDFMVAGNCTCIYPGYKGKCPNCGIERDFKEIT